MTDKNNGLEVGKGSYGERVEAIFANPDVPEARRAELRDLILTIEGESVATKLAQKGSDPDAVRRVTEVAGATGASAAEVLTEGVMVMGRKFDEVLDAYSHMDGKRKGYAKITDYSQALRDEKNVAVRSDTMGAELKELSEIVDKHGIQKPLVFEINEGGVAYKIHVVGVADLLHFQVYFDNPADGRKYMSRFSVSPLSFVSALKEQPQWVKHQIPQFEEGKYFNIKGWEELYRMKEDGKDFDFHESYAYKPKNDRDLNKKLKLLEPFTLDKLFQLVRERGAEG